MLGRIWAEEDWEETIDRFLGLLPELPDDVKKAYQAVTGSPANGTSRDFADVLTATVPVFFVPQRLAEFFSDVNPRVLELWKHQKITLQQVQFYSLCLFRDAFAKPRGSKSEWLPSIPDLAS